MPPAQGCRGGSEQQVEGGRGMGYFVDWRVSQGEGELEGGRTGGRVGGREGGAWSRARKALPSELCQKA